GTGTGLFLGGRQLAHAERELLVHHDYFAARDQPAIERDVDRLADQPVQLHDRADVQPQDVLDLHACRAERGDHLDLDVVQAPDALALDVRVGLRGAGMVTAGLVSLLPRLPFRLLRAGGRDGLNLVHRLVRRAARSLAGPANRRPLAIARVLVVQLFALALVVTALRGRQ